MVGGVESGGEGKFTKLGKPDWLFRFEEIRGYEELAMFGGAEDGIMVGCDAIAASSRASAS